MESIKQQSTLHFILHNLWKWLIITGVISLVLQLFTNLILLAFLGNIKTPAWGITWLLVTIIVLFAGTIAAIITNWKDIKDYFNLEYLK